MSESAVQIIARGPRSVAEAAAASLDADPLLEGAKLPTQGVEEAFDGFVSALEWDASIAEQFRAPNHRGLIAWRLRWAGVMSSEPGMDDLRADVRDIVDDPLFRQRFPHRVLA